MAPLIAPPAALVPLQVGTGFTQVFLQVLGMGLIESPCCDGNGVGGADLTDSNSIAGV